MSTSTRRFPRYLASVFVLALAFAFLPLVGPAPVAQAAPDAPSWDMVTEVPGAPDGRFALKVWTGERDVLYALTQHSDVPYDMQVHRFDHGTWNLELELPGYYPTFLFGTAPDDIYASGYTCLQPDDSWACPGSGADESVVFHFDGSSWNQLTMPAELDGLITNTIAGVPGEVQIAARPYVVRNTGTEWAVAHDATALNIHPNVMTFVAPDEGYFASCWGHAVWDGATWTEKVEFDFCDLTDAWGSRTGTGDLNLWLNGNNNFQNGVRIWRFDEATQSFGAKYSPEFADPAPASDTTNNVGTGTALWGAAADDVFAGGVLWDPYPDYRSGRIYHFDGASWTQMTGMGEISGVLDVWGTETDDVWFSLDGGQILHYGTTPEYAADWSFRAEAPHDIWSSGGSWDVGTEILVLVNDGQTGAEFAETVQVEQWGAEPWDVGWYVNTGDFEIEPDDLITVYDNRGSKNLTVVGLTVDDIDMTNETVSGTSPADAVLEIYVSDETAGTSVEVTANGSGAWDANLAGIFDVRPGTWGSAAMLDEEGDATERNWHIQMPELNVTPDNDTVDGYYFEMGATVTVEIDDPTNGTAIDWSGSAVAALPPWDADHSYVTFSPADDGFDVAAGQTVTMSDGVTTKTLEVSPLAITDIDEANDLVHGTATPDVTIQLWVSDGQDPGRDIVVAGDGTWTADYTAAQGDSQAHDIGPGYAFDANEYDDDGDTTHAYVGLPDPLFSVETPNQIWSHGDGWIAGSTANITILEGGTEVYTASVPVETWGPNPWEVGWSTNTGGFEIEPGMVVVIDDGGDIEQQLEVVALAVTDVDEDADTISGTAPPFAWVNGDAGNEFENAGRYEQADASGNFTINFGAPGVEDWEQDTVDLRPGIGGSVQVFDLDGDSTHRGWHVSNPHFGVDVVHEEMWANDWPIGATLDFQVFSSPDKSVLLKEDSMTVVDTTWGQSEAGYRFYEFNVEGGQYIEITDGTTTRELIVSTLEVTNVDPDSDTYTGLVHDSEDLAYEVCAWARDLNDPQQSVELCTLPDATDGTWSIDFTGVGEIFPGEHTGAYQLDPDGDQTSYSWHVPPWLYVEIGDDTNPDFPDRIHLDQWVFPVEVTNGIATTVVSDLDGDTWEVVDFDVSPGQTITATGDDGRVKSLHLEELSVDTVTLWNDDPASTVYGSTTATYEGGIQVTASADYGWWTERWVNAAAGAYEADFGNPGNGWREQELGYFGQGGADDVYSGGEIRAHIYDADNDQVQAIWHATNPRIIIVRGNDRIEAIDFPKDEPLTIELDDPAFAGIEFSETGIPAANPDKPWETLLVFELGDYTVPDEATVTALDEEGTTIVETEVIPFSIGLVDPNNDTITGTAEEGSEVLVEADGNWRYPIADDTNTWVADFSEPGTQPGEENPVDIGPGSSGGATLLAEGGSATTVLWSISNARFSVDRDEEHVWGWEFLPNASVTITVEGEDQGSFPTDDGGSFDAYLDPSVVNIGVEFEVIVSDGETTKDHLVTSVAITDVDADNDQVSGTAEIGTEVHAWVNDTGVSRNLSAIDGTWVADFAAADPSGTWNIVPGDNGGAEQCDDDGDCTQPGWSVANPAVHVDPRNDALWGDGWAPDGEVTISIDDVEHSTLPTDEWGNFGEGWDPQGIEVAAGVKVDVTQGDTTKTHYVTTLAITGMDVDTEIMTGTADGPFEIWVHDTEAHRSVDHDGAGEWSVDWSVPGPNEGEEATADLEPGTNGNSHECDDDDDCTWADWRVAQALFRVDPMYGGIWGHEWYDLTEVTVTTDTGFSEVVEVDENGDWGTGADPADVLAGTTVTVTGGDITKTLVVSALTIAEVNEAEDAVSGTAETGTDIQIEIHEINDEVWRVEVADGAGEWTADFTDFVSDETGQGSITFEPGTHGAAYQTDDDADTTWINWNVANPTVNVDGHHDGVWGEQWLPNDEVTIWIDDVEHSTLATDEWGNFGDEWDPQGLDLAAGVKVEVTQGDTTKTHYVTSLEITGIDIDTETISGVADGPFDIWVHDTDAWRHLDHGGGAWSVDWTVPAYDEAGNGTADLEYGSNGNSNECDDDGDCTWAEWDVPLASFSVRVDEGEVHGYTWALGLDVTLEIDDLNNGEGVDYSATLAPVPAPWDNEQTWVQFMPGSDGFDLGAGQIVTMTNGDLTKFHIVAPLEVTDADPDADTVSGTADANASLRVDVYDGGFGHDLMSGENGDWTADFSPGAEQGEFDLVPGTSGEASEYDEDGDSTKQGWEVPGDVGGAPEILFFEGPFDPMSYFVEVSAVGAFEDPDQDGDHVVHLDWGDGSMTYPEPTYEDGVGTVSGSHLYAEPGVYTLTMTVTDEDGQTADAVYEYVVLYNPFGRKIIASVRVYDGDEEQKLGMYVKPNRRTGVLEGDVAYNPDGGSASEGFQATELSYLWVFGDWGVVGGSGTIAGEGDYGFFVTALDQNRKGGIDAFRVKVWSAEDPGDVIYDTQPGDPDYTMPTTEPSAGDIKVR